MSLKMRVRALIMAGPVLMFYQGSQADETDLLWCTLLGGSGRDMARTIAVDGSGNTYLIGLSESIDFPTTTGVFDTSRAGGFDAFIAKPALTATAVTPDNQLVMAPKNYTLQRCFPNPFNSATKIRYQVTRQTRVTLRIFNTLGQEVKAPWDGDREPGSHVATWDGRDKHSREVASGLYLGLFTADNYRSAVKMVLIR
jgi:hypothetical protein